MARIVHALSMLNGTVLAEEDRMAHGHFADQVTPAGNGTITAIAAGTAGAGYQTIPTVAFSVPASGAKNTGSGAAATAVMGVVAVPTIASAGSGGTNGAVTLTGTTGSGTKFQLTGTIAGGVLTAISAISVAGAYTAMPSSLTAEPVTGGSLTGCTVNLSAAMGVVSYTVGTPGSNYPVGFVTASLSGGTPTTPAVPGAVTVTSAAGASSAMDVALLLPAKYVVQATPAFDGTVWASGKTQAGFILNFSPRLAATTLAASTVDFTIDA